MDIPRAVSAGQLMGAPTQMVITVLEGLTDEGRLSGPVSRGAAFNLIQFNIAVLGRTRIYHDVKMNVSRYSG